MILTALGGETGLFALGDILVSSARPSGPDLPLPLQFGPAAQSSAGHSLTGFAQKLVAVSPTLLVSWAGSHVVARGLVQAVREASKGGTRVDLESVVGTSGLSEGEIGNVSLIVHQVIGAHIEIETLNARQGEVDGIRAAWEGSGAFDFLQDTIVDAGGSDATFQVILRGLLLRVASTLAGEAVDGAPYDYLYGGWFELVISRTLGLRKIPYAIKFWGRRDGELGYDAPLFFNWYRGRTLHVCSLDQHSGSSDVRVLEVPDILSGRRWRMVRCKPVFRPEFTFHVIMDDRLPHLEIHISDRHSEGHMDVAVGRGGDYTMGVRREFLDRIMGGAVTPDFTVRKASDPNG